MPQQHRFTTPVEVTQNVTRVASIEYHPHRGLVVVLYEIGEETGGVFTRNETETKPIPFADLPQALKDVFDDLEAAAEAGFKTLRAPECWDDPEAFGG